MEEVTIVGGSLNLLFAMAFRHLLSKRALLEAEGDCMHHRYCFQMSKKEVSGSFFLFTTFSYKAVHQDVFL